MHRIHRIRKINRIFGQVHIQVNAQIYQLSLNKYIRPYQSYYVVIAHLSHIKLTSIVASRITKSIISNLSNFTNVATKV